MKNISFDNPYWLIIAIPLLLAIVIPFFISMNKDNRNKGWIASLVIHVVMVIAVALAASGLTYTAIMTRTKVYIVADVSYSASRNFDEIDEYIADISRAMPQNSRLGIVCFGKDSVILTSSGTEIKSVKEAKVDDSGTNIASALDYTSTLFSEGEKKRIILITDGCDTAEEGSVVAAVERLMAKDIKIDTVYVDSNLKADESEVQISDADYTRSTYVSFKTAVKLLVESNGESDIIADLYRKSGDSDYEKIETTVFRAEAGINLISFNLPTDSEGVFDYKATVSAEGDRTQENNSYLFSQSVAGKRKIMLVTENLADVTAINKIYNGDAEIELHFVSEHNRNVPYTVEELSLYDEIILSNVDVRNINNVGALIDSIDTVVSRFGKSLITFGDLSMQNKDNEAFDKLSELLPVSFGNANKDEKLYTIVLDVSRSMNDTSQLTIAKDAAIKLLSLLEDEDSVVYVPFAGKVLVEQGWKPMKLGDIVDFEGSSENMTYRQWLYREIQNAEPYQGTLLGAALEQAYKNIKDLSFAESQVMIISDGLSYSFENEDAITIAREMREKDNITVSAISVISTAAQNMLPMIAEAGGGTHYSLNRAEEVADLVFATIADDLTESVINSESKVNIVNYRDDTLLGIISLPNVYGYVNSKAKLDAELVLTVNYQKSPTVTVEVPLYSYRDHGNGRISTFTSSLSGEWLRDWADETRDIFFGNVLDMNTPDERIDYPFDIKVEYLGSSSNIEILPSYLNPRARAYIKITSPDGTVQEKELVFDRNGYSTTVKSEVIGRYDIHVTYSYGTHSFEADSSFNVSYSPEYNAFEAYDIGNIYAFMRNAGVVYTNGEVDLGVNKSEVATYKYSFRIPLLILASVLLVCDIFIRKTKWRDIVNLFTAKKKKGGKKNA